MGVKATYFEDAIGHGFECSGPGCGGERVFDEDDSDGFVILAPDAKHRKGERVAGFFSRGWPTKGAAQARFKQHAAEHESGKAAPDQAVLFLQITEGQGAGAALAKQLKEEGSK